MIEKAEELVTIDGEIPNEKVRDLMLSQATRASLAVIDNMRVTGELASEFFPWALERAWAILPYLEHMARFYGATAGFPSAGGLPANISKPSNRRMTASFFASNWQGLS